jgi:A/G-specific adenine glycosylase
MASGLARQLLTWYRDHARALPWRQTNDPYVIWVSEIMLLQTRVEVVIPYFDRWMARFPTVRALAEASTDDVLAAWEGLGYYRRALNLQRGARAVVEAGGQVPRSGAELVRLPGIRRYTAAAIATFAFGADEIAPDGNLRRVSP